MRVHFARFGASLALIAAVVLMAGGLSESPSLLTWLYVILAVLILARWHSDKDIAYFVVPMVLGPAAEAIAIAGGAWHYAGVDSIPIWLPLAWGLTGFGVRNTTVATLGVVSAIREAIHRPAKMEG